jgi:hypothetical protein
MNSGNCVFVKAKRGLGNRLSKFAFFESEVLAVSLNFNKTCGKNTGFLTTDGLNYASHIPHRNQIK